jgi:hypothetical protein
MVLGDTHGDAGWCVHVTRLAGRHGVQRVLQVGDFGFWPEIKLDRDLSVARRLLQQIDWACEEYNVLGWDFIDGNHDDHRALRDIQGHHQPDDDGMFPVSRYVRYSPRGNSFKLDGTIVGTLGGAVSIDALLEQTGIDFGDKEPYRVDWDWFPDLESPTLADIEKLPDHVDLLLTHEAPQGVDLRHLDGFPGLAIPPDVQAATDAARDIVAEAVYRTSPALVIHGHWHGRNRAHLDRGPCDVLGLASNSRQRGRDNRSFAILDLPDLTLKTVSTRP